MNDQILIGLLVTCLCGLGLWHSRWLLLRTRKGLWLADRFGRKQGLRVLRLLLIAGAIFGLMLATDWIHPVEW